jgi:hypothetical protein
MNTIAAINDVLLPVVLFVIYFVFVSIVRYNLKEKANVSTEKEVSKKSKEQTKPFTYKDAFSADYDPDPVPEITEEIIASVQQENIVPVVAKTTEEQEDNQETTIVEDHQSIPEIIDSLGKRDIRKLCSPLGIQQKTNGTELTTELMKALVKRKFKENPQLVFEVMSDRFPSLMSTMSQGEQQQQLDPLAC